MHPKIQALPTSKHRYVRVAESLYLDSKTGIYYVRKSFKRYRIPELFQTTRETTVGRAKARAQELIKEHLDHYLGGKPGLISKREGKSVASVINEILEVVTPGKRLTTQENHKLYLGELKTEWGQWDIGRISLAAWQGWLTDFKRRKSRKTFMDYAKNMNLVLRYAYQQKYASHLLTLPNPDPIQTDTGRVFTRKELKSLWKAMNEETKDQFVLCYECFMRLREALYLTWDRVDLVRGEVTLRAEDVKTGSKTGRGRTFRLSPLALSRLKERKKESESRFVFPSPSDPDKPMHQNKTAWASAKKNAGITGKAKWHSLRHSAITHALLDAKADPIQVSEYAGVSFRTIQRVYLHSTSEKTKEVAKTLSIITKKT